MLKTINLQELERFKDNLDMCTKCGYCTFWCPLYQEQPLESSVSRGKYDMLRQLLAGEREYTKEFSDDLNRCLLCMTCTEHCPEQAQTPPVIVAARADKVRAKGLKFPQNIIYRWLIPHRSLFGNVVRFASWFQGVFMPKTEGTIRHLSLFFSAMGEGRHIPEIAPRFLRQIMDQMKILQMAMHNI